MTNNPTIDGVSRELLERVIESAGVRDDSPYFMDGIKELRALLDAPAVERQEPTTAMTDAGCQAYMDADGMIGIMHNSSMEHAYIAMRALDPEFAAPPAPVAVVLPERQPVAATCVTRDRREGWNACLDATAALNGVKS